jgi:hypothetical protein
MGAGCQAEPLTVAAMRRRFAAAMALAVVAMVLAVALIGWLT